MNNNNTMANPCQTQGAVQQSSGVVGSKREKSFLLILLVLPSLLAILGVANFMVLKKKAKRGKEKRPIISQPDFDFSATAQYRIEATPEIEVAVDKEIVEPRKNFPAAKVTPEMRAQMQELRDAGVAVTEIAIRFGIGVSTVYAKTCKS